MGRILDVLKGKKWIEMVAAILVFIGLWLGSFVKEITIEMRILQMAMMMIGVAVCGIYEFANRAEVREEEREKKESADAKTGNATFYTMLAVYGIIIIYCVAFERNQLLTVMAAVLFAHIIIQGIFRNKHQRELGIVSSDKERGNESGSTGQDRKRSIGTVARKNTKDIKR